MTTLLFDTAAMDQTAQMISDSAGEYEVLASQIVADADLGAMPPEVSAFVGSELGSISQTLRDSATALSSDAQLLAWRSEAARLADDPSLGAVAEMLYGTGATVGGSELLAGLMRWDLGGADPLTILAGCACSLGGYGVVNYDPTTQEGWGDQTATSSAWGEGSYQSSYVGDSGDVIEIPIQPLDLGSSGSSDFTIHVEPLDVGSTSGYSVPIEIPDPLAPPDPSTTIQLPLDPLPNISYSAMPSDTYIYQPNIWGQPGYGGHPGTGLFAPSYLDLETGIYDYDY